MRLALIVAAKELRDHARDVRSLLSAALLTLMGPGVVLIVSWSDRASGKDNAAVLLGMLSIFALVSSFAGAIDIAMDAAAGERERRSLLPLLLNPIPASQVVLGKWIAVAAFGLAAMVLNALGVIAVLGWAAPVALAARLSQIAAWIALGLVPLTLLGAAVNLLVAVMCRTAKEAHSALRYLAFVPMLIGMFLVFFPGWIGRMWFVLPIVGQQALIGLAAEPVPVAQGVILAIVTLAAAVPVLALAAGVLRRDEILAA